MEVRVSKVFWWNIEDCWHQPQYWYPFPSAASIWCAFMPQYPSHYTICISDPISYYHQIYCVLKKNVWCIQEYFSINFKLSCCLFCQKSSRFLKFVLYRRLIHYGLWVIHPSISASTRYCALLWINTLFWSRVWIIHENLKYIELQSLILKSYWFFLALKHSSWISPVFAEKLNANMSINRLSINPSLCKIDDLELLDWLSHFGGLNKYLLFTKRFILQRVPRKSEDQRQAWLGWLGFTAERTLISNKKLGMETDYTPINGKCCQCCWGGVIKTMENIETFLWCFHYLSVNSKYLMFKSKGMWQIYRLELRVPVNVVQVALTTDSTDCLQQSLIRIRPVLSLSFSYSSNLQCSYAQESLKNPKKESNNKTRRQAYCTLSFFIPVIIFCCLY